MKQELILKEKLPDRWKIYSYKECTIKQPEKKLKKFKVTEYNKIGKFPIIDQGKDFIAGYTDEESEIIDLKQPVIVFGDHTLSIKYIDFPFARGADGTQIIIPNLGKTIPKFFYYLLKSLNIEVKNYERYFKYVKKRNFLLPPLPIQQQIVAKLDAQMAQIEIMKKEAEKEKGASESYYESFTNNLIINSEYGTPCKILGVCKDDKKQIVATSNESRKKIYIGMEDISSNSGKITVNQSNQAEKILSNTFQFDDRHVLYGKLRPYLNKVALPTFSGRCSTELIPLLPKENCKREFLALLLRTEKVICAAMKNKTGSRMPRADMDEVMNVEFNLPSLPEQEKIIVKLNKFCSHYETIMLSENEMLEAISLLPSVLLNEVFGKYDNLR